MRLLWTTGRLGPESLIVLIFNNRYEEVTESTIRIHEFIVQLHHRLRE